MKVTLKFQPIPKNRRILGEMFDDMKKSGVDIEYSGDLDTVIVESKHQPTTEKILLVHGYQITGNYIDGAMKKLADKYQLDEMHLGAPDLRGIEDSSRVIGTPHQELNVSKRKPSVSKRTLRSFIQNKLRHARQSRSKRRVQHVRDNLEGQVQAYEEILRYLKKR